ncbi:uncharacterized protein LOC124796106 [Schistocerca piceifrons]|uniref:uncharacterized protein LOC124796106 n=1 Tax=Schistocerca piceifrons TaxID=274613 RepID=UPI001F5E99CD|nr:uncharacterized protein LOC124796106 [Schistocerca piceifrons]
MVDVQLIIEIKVGKEMLDALLDSGSSVSALLESFMNIIKNRELVIFPVTGVQVETAVVNGTKTFLGEGGINIPNLCKLLEKNAASRWNEECETEFHGVKDKLCISKILYHHDMNFPFCLASDSSDYGISCELFQENLIDGRIEHRSVAFSGCMINKHKRGQKSDSIVGILGSELSADCRILNDRLMRWAMFMQQFEYEIRDIKDTENGFADALSRLPIGAEDNGREDSNEFKLLCMTGVAGEEEIRAVCKDMQRAQNDDPVVRHIKVNFDSKGYEKIPKDYKIHKGELFRRKDEETDKWRLSFPNKYLKQLIDYVHLSH